MQNNTETYRITIFGGREFDFESESGNHRHGFTWYGFKSDGKRLKFTSAELLDGINDILPYEEWDEQGDGTETKQFYLKGVKKFDPGNCLEINVREDFDWNKGIPKFRMV